MGISRAKKREEREGRIVTDRTRGGGDFSVLPSILLLPLPPPTFFLPSSSSHHLFSPNVG